MTSFTLHKPGKHLETTGTDDPDTLIIARAQRG